MKQEKNITIEVNEKQLDKIIESMEFYFRFFLGQPDDNRLRHICYDKGKIEEYEQWIKDTKSLFFDLKQDGASFSYTKEPLMYEITRTLMHFRANSILNLSKTNVQTDEPLKPTDIPLPKVGFSK